MEEAQARLLNYWQFLRHRRKAQSLSARKMEDFRALSKQPLPRKSRVGEHSPEFRYKVEDDFLLKLQTLE